MTRREGVLTHAILEDFERAAMTLRARGLSQSTADRIGLFLALTTSRRPRWSIAQAWAVVDSHFPRDATRQGGAGTPPNAPLSSPTAKDQSHA